MRIWLEKLYGRVWPVDHRVDIGNMVQTGGRQHSIAWQMVASCLVLDQGKVGLATRLPVCPHLLVQHQVTVSTSLLGPRIFAQLQIGIVITDNIDTLVITGQIILMYWSIGSTFSSSCNQVYSYIQHFACFFYHIDNIDLVIHAWEPV